MSRKEIAIIGAGVSGLAAAWSLRQSGAHVTLFEKSRGVSGRAASRTRNGVRYDHGANYFKTPGRALSELIHQHLPTEELVRIEKDIRIFDRTGSCFPGDPEIDTEPRWTYSSGISTLAKLLLDASGAKLERAVRIHRIDRNSQGWRVTDEAGNDRGVFDSVLMTAPAPQAAEIVGAGELPPTLGARLVAHLGGVPYHRQFSVVLAMDETIDRRGDFYALVNTDRGHDIAWLSFENDKPGRTTGEQTVLVVQMAPDWSLHHFAAPFEKVIAHATEAASTLLGYELPVAWADCQRWKFAHPFSRADPEVLAAGESHGLFFAGDCLIGKGRVHRALETGLDAGCRIHGHLRLAENSPTHP